MAVLDGDRGKARAIRREFREIGAVEAPVRNIYWIGGYPGLMEFAEKRSIADVANSPKL